MAHNLLTITQITREAARILHQESNFLKNCTTAYDSQFAQTGGKIGSTLNVRLPSMYTVRTNATYAGQDHVERSTPITVSSQYGVDVSFTTFDRTCSLDDFSKRVLRPALSRVSAKLEAESMAVAYKSVANYVNATTNAVLTYKYFQQANARLSENLAPRSDRVATLSPASSVEFMDATKGLFHASANLSEQFKEGSMGYTAGCNVFENTLLPSHTTGTMAGSALSFGATLGVTTNTNSWASQTDLSITGATSATTLLAGDIITLSGVYAVNENKASTGKLKSFIVQTAVTMTTAATTYTVTVKPALIWNTANAYQNASVPGGTTTGLTATLIGAVGVQFGQDLFMHKDAFIFSTVDLEDVSPYGAQCARATIDNLSIRWVQQYAIGSDTVAGRFDVLWGFAPLYPELACVHRYTASLT